MEDEIPTTGKTVIPNDVNINEIVEFLEQFCPPPSNETIDFPTNFHKEPEINTVNEKSAFYLCNEASHATEDGVPATLPNAILIDKTFGPFDPENDTENTDNFMETAESVMESECSPTSDSLPSSFLLLFTFRLFFSVFLISLHYAILFLFVLLEYPLP